MPVPVGQILSDLASAAPHRPAITCGDQTMTRAQLESAANRLARAYEKLGVSEGSFVTIGLPNSIDFYVACFATWKLGATPQPVSHALPERERAAIIDLVHPALVVGFDDLSARRTSVPVGFRADPGFDDTPIEPIRTPPSWKAPTSGGSTGRPKLIVSGSPGSLEPSAGLGMGMLKDGVHLVPGPLYHNGPFVFSMVGLYAGNHLVVLPRFDPVAALEAIQDHRVDFAFFVPTMLQRIWRVLQDNPGRHDISSLKTVWTGAAPCPDWLKAAWIELVGPDGIIEMYGGTEGQSMTTITGTEWLQHRGSVGKPVYGEMKVFGPEGQELAPGDVGEIFMRGPEGAPPSYRYIGAEARERQGWESIGDLGWMDTDGYLYLSDRRTDLILAGGANIYPAEVEAAILEHPAVETCVVVGLPDPDLGQRVHALVHPAGVLTDEQLREFLTDRLVRYKVPRSFRFVDTPLRDDAGKVRRSELRDREVALLAGDRPE